MQAVLDRLVSQAEKRGVTLAEVINEELALDEVDRIQQYIRREMSENYDSIEEFMRDIEVPGTYDFSSMDDSELDSIQQNILTALSDNSVTSEA